MDSDRITKLSRRFALPPQYMRCVRQEKPRRCGLCRPPGPWDMSCRSCRALPHEIFQVYLQMALTDNPLKVWSPTPYQQVLSFITME